MNATNTFQDGLVMDAHPLATPNNVLTNCLNGTLVTYNGNELILLNDVGNSKIFDTLGLPIKLSQGFIPIGLKEFGGILYIFSVNPSRKDSQGRCLSEIGSFPSPDYPNTSGKLVYKYSPLQNYDLGSYNNKMGLGDFTTYNLDFDVNHPLTIDCLKSQDESVNLIFTDNKNIPRLINTRFSLYGDTNYELVDRSGEKDSNIYYNEDFEYSTSLHKIVNSIVNIKFNGVLSGGNLLVGNYTFYFTLADSDDNQSDFVGQSGMVTCHKGHLNDPYSVDGGIENENSYKQVSFTIENIPRLFSRVYVYYSRSSSDASEQPLVTFKKLVKYFEVEDDHASFIISGYEQTLDIDLTVINNNYTIIDRAKALAIAQDILFYGNVKLSDDSFDYLSDFSLNNISYEFINKELGNVNFDYSYPDSNPTYRLDGRNINSKGGYYNTDNIYYFTGYWPSEFYRFGIVYIMDDYSLSPVFNIRGNYNNNEYGIFRFSSDYDLNKTSALGIRFTLNDKPEHVIGYFFVRLKRIKTILCQGVRIGSDLEFSHLPLLYYDEPINSTELAITITYHYATFTFDPDTLEPITKYEDGSIQWSGDLAIDELKRWGDAYYDQMYDSDGNLKQGHPTLIVSPIPYNTETIYDGEEHSANPITLGWFTESFVRQHFETIFGVLSRSWKKQYGRNRIFDKYLTTLGMISDFKKPLLKIESSYIGSDNVRRIAEQFGITDNYWKDEKIYYKKNDEIVADAMIAPEYETNQPYFNCLFTGGKLLYRTVGKYENLDWENFRQFTTKDFVKNENSNIIRDAYVVAVPEGTGAVRAKDNVYCSIAGEPAEALRVKVPLADFRVIADADGDNKEIDGLKMKTDDADVTWASRGIWGPYLGIEEAYTTVNPNVYDVVNVLIPNYSELLANSESIIKSREQDYSAFYPVTNRINIEDTLSADCFRGDCFICNFTHTMNRTFADPSFPINNEIADINTWYKGYRVKYDTLNPIYNTGTSSGDKFRVLWNKDTAIHADSLVYLNRSDVNAVVTGHVFTTKVYSSTNLCMRSTDGSNITEKATFNLNRSFYPLRKINDKAGSKIADSYLMNGAYSKSLGEQIYNPREDLPAYLTNFANRIVYSDVAVKDSYINNFRTFRGTSFQDYTRLYGEIVKLLNLYDGSLLCVFEHAIATIAVNEKAVAAQSESGFAYITTNNVLSDTPVFLTTEYGSLWPDSVILTATGVYGVDTVAKKIWTYRQTFEALSDFRIGRFLKDNLVATEYETLPDITSFNVKTHYNERKQDIMFTFFKKIGDDFIGWNICYNEITKKWTTFYSWIPSYSGNINNTFYSFDNEYSLGDLKNTNSNYLWQHNKENNWCNWYDEQHPFEFEFIVADNPQVHKIFNNLKMIANKTLPESFHYEVVGEVYDFKHDKRNMYFRQEKTKEIFHDNGCDITYDENYKDIHPKRNPKSAMCPLTVSRVDRKNKLYDIYLKLTSKSQDYQSMSGSEIVFDRTTNDFDVATHIKAYPLDGFEWTPFVYDDDPNREQLKLYYKSHGIEIRHNDANECWEKKVEYGRRLGNCKYAEDVWDILIPAINYAEKNESWTDEPPVNIAMTPVPEDLMVKGELSNVPSSVELDYWGDLKLTRLRDKYIRIKVRYTGNDLSIISAMITQYKESYN